MNIDPVLVKEKSESLILAEGGKICDWLPFIGLEEIHPRSERQVAERALVLNVLVNISFGAPISFAVKWLEDNQLIGALSQEEAVMLKSNNQPSQEKINLLRWNIETLWAAAWVGGFAENLTPTQPITDELASYFPDLKEGESSAPFYERYHLRQPEDIYRKLDHLYRAHWYARDCQLSGASSGSFNLGVVHYRRLFLEWALNQESDWDSIDVST